MKYDQYIVKKRLRALAICGTVNIPWGTILPVVDGFIIYKGQHLCAITSQNAKDYFWGYDPENPETEIERQKAVAVLLATAPQENGDVLADPANSWSRYGHLEQIPGAWTWVWFKDMEDLPQTMAEYLLDCIHKKKQPAGSTPANNGR